MLCGKERRLVTNSACHPSFLNFLSHKKLFLTCQIRWVLSYFKSNSNKKNLDEKEFQIRLGANKKSIWDRILNKMGRQLLAPPLLHARKKKEAMRKPSPTFLLGVRSRERVLDDLDSQSDRSTSSSWVLIRFKSSSNRVEFERLSSLIQSSLKSKYDLDNWT